MKPRQELIENGIINENKIVSYAFIASFYRDQLKKFHKLGIGEVTENDVKVTQELINITRKRLGQIRPLITYRKIGERQ